MYTTEHPDGQIAVTSNDEIQLLVGISDSELMADVRYSLPDGVEMLSRNDTLRYMRVAVPTMNPAEAIGYFGSEIQTHSAVEYAEFNPVYKPIENDCNRLEYPENTADPRLRDQYAPQQVRAPEAWEAINGVCGEQPTIAVLDTGTDYEHPDLEKQFGENLGRDFGDNDDDPMPSGNYGSYHGTHTAGTAAATIGNETGVAGISDAQILACKLMGDDNRTFGDRVADALQWATDNGADVANMSIGGTGEYGLKSETVERAVQRGTDNGMLSVASAGNSGTDTIQYPAAHPTVVGVTAIDANEEIANFTDYGPKTDLCGPGVDVLSTFPDGEYSELSGTSMSAPAVAGVALLGKAVKPEISPMELQRAMKETAVDLGHSPEKQGAGRVDALNLVNRFL